jgi:hypothetical protein
MLPPELRLEIYRHAFILSAATLAPSDAITAAKPLQTCKQLCDEAAPTFYGNNIFGIDLRNSHIPSIFMDNNLAPRIKHICLRQLLTPQAFNGLGKIEHYSFPELIMQNLDSLSSITLGATFLISGEVPPPDVFELAAKTWLPNGENLIHAYFIMLFYTSKIRRFLRRKNVAMNLVIFYYNSQALPRAGNTVVAPQKVLYYKMKLLDNAIHLDFQRCLREGDALWRMQYEVQTAESIKKYRLFGEWA